ncbi:MAG TPA: oxidoreductase, partial [Roseiarcus sp.]|nr:oxidoreductase [Roseiarcus sp.]
TGLQQVTCLVDRLGAGISQAIGTGGHDLSQAVGGVTFLQGVKALADDAATRIIVLISKPPAPEVAAAVLAEARKAGKPVVVNFLGADLKAIAGPNLAPVMTLEDAAVSAVALSKREPPSRLALAAPRFEPPRLTAGQRYIRGLYSGGTFCYEATLLLGDALRQVYSNTPAGRAKPLDDVWKSRAHTLVDLGDDLFTRGRPHPMIDHRLRDERIASEARDPETAVILLDVVIGYGAHADPAAEIAPVVHGAIAQAAAAGRSLSVVGFVCGTKSDPQSLADQEARLRAAGMTLTQSNAQAVRLAAQIVAQTAENALAASEAGSA